MRASQLLPGEFHIPDEVYSQYTEEQKKEIEAWRTRYLSDEPAMVALRSMDRHNTETEVDCKASHTVMNARGDKEYRYESKEVSYDLFCEQGGTEIASDFDLERMTEERESREILRQALSSLSSEERCFLEQIYANGGSQRKLATGRGVSKTKIFRMQRRILKKLKKYFF